MWGGGHRSGAAGMGCYGTFQGAALNVHSEPQLCLPRGPRLGRRFSASSPVMVWVKLTSEKQLSSQDRCQAEGQRACLAAAMATSADIRDHDAGFGSLGPLSRRSLPAPAG